MAATPIGITEAGSWELKTMNCRCDRSFEIASPPPAFAAVLDAPPQNRSTVTDRVTVTVRPY